MWCPFVLKKKNDAFLSLSLSLRAGERDARRAQLALKVVALEALNDQLEDVLFKDGGRAVADAEERPARSLDEGDAATAKACLQAFCCDVITDDSSEAVRTAVALLSQAKKAAQRLERLLLLDARGRARARRLARGYVYIHHLRIFRLVRCVRVGRKTGLRGTLSLSLSLSLECRRMERVYSGEPALRPFFSSRVARLERCETRLERETHPSLFLSEKRTLYELCSNESGRRRDLRVGDAGARPAPARGRPRRRPRGLELAGLWRGLRPLHADLQVARDEHSESGSRRSLSSAAGATRGRVATRRSLVGVSTRLYSREREREKESLKVFFLFWEPFAELFRILKFLPPLTRGPPRASRESARVFKKAAPKESRVWI